MSAEKLIKTIEHMLYNKIKSASRKINTDYAETLAYGNLIQSLKQYILEELRDNKSCAPESEINKFANDLTDLFNDIGQNIKMRLSEDTIDKIKSITKCSVPIQNVLTDFCDCILTKKIIRAKSISMHKLLFENLFVPIFYKWKLYFHESYNDIKEFSNLLLELNISFASLEHNIRFNHSTQYIGALHTTITNSTCDKKRIYANMIDFFQK